MPHAVLEKLGEVEVRRGERAVERLGVGDPVETKGPQLLAQVAVADQIPGVLAVEDAVGIEAAPRRGAAPQRPVVQRHRGPVANRAVEQQHEPLLDVPGSLRSRQGESARGLLDLARGSVQLVAEPVDRGVHVRGGPQRRIVQGQGQDRPFGGGQGQKAHGCAFDEPVAAFVVGGDRDAVRAGQVREVAVGSADGDPEVVGDLLGSPGAPAAEALHEQVKTD